MAHGWQCLETTGQGTDEAEGEGVGVVLNLSLPCPAVPVPPANLSLGLGAQPPALRASWSPPAGDWDGFLLRLYRLRPPALEGEETLAPEAQNFSWDQLAPGTEFLAWLATLRGPDESSGVNATGWTRECPPHGPASPAPLAKWLSRVAQPQALCVCEWPLT